ncbi:MAG: hypothetical protein B7Z71_10425, partial [Acidocella sp. 21-58-7]
WQRLLVGGAYGTLAAAVFGFGAMFLHTWREYEVFNTRHIRYEQRLTALESDIAYDEVYLTRLLKSPDFFEHVARERLGYARADEWVFKFREGRVSSHGSVSG